MELIVMLNLLYDLEIATMDEINLVTAINGFNKETMQDILYVKTGYRSFKQFVEEDVY